MLDRWIKEVYSYIQVALAVPFADAPQLEDVAVAEGQQYWFPADFGMAGGSDEFEFRANDIAAAGLTTSS
jgi:hypothetical protein